MSNTYLVLSAVQIFEWMTRTPELKLIRGASATLRVQTSKATIKTRFPALDWCEAAGDVDGVVAIEFQDRTADEVDPARWATEIVTEHLAKELPAVVWEAWWAESEHGYLAAYEKYEEARFAGFEDSESVGRATYLPRPFEPPLAESCAGCRREPAHPARPHDDKKGRLGADCQNRHEAGKRLTSGRQAWTFKDLAEKGGLTTAERSLPSRHRSRNHLATIHADGNGVGGLMSRLASKKELAGLRSKIITELDRATRDAYEKANAVVSEGSRVEGSILHFGGGDDLLVSVAAPQAWDFVMVLASTFEERLAGLLRDHARDLEQIGGIGANQVSLGIGMTFAHASHPVADARDLAFKAMKQAKDRVRGEQSAVVWLDLTAEDRLPKHRKVKLSTLLEERRDDRANPVMTLSPSARSILGEIVNDCGARIAKAGNREELAKARRQARDEVERWSKRTQRSVAFDGLEDSLSRARWWPTTPIPDELKPKEARA